MLSEVYRVMDARGKFGEHESFVSALQTSQVHPSLDIRTAKSMSKFFYNIADKNACFLINCKILVTRDTITNGDTPQSSSLNENILSVKVRKKICFFIR